MHRRTLAALALSAGVYTAQALPCWGTVVDDAYISARYAQLLSLGLGPGYNATTPAVEGVTNPSWTLLLAGGLGLGLPVLPLMTGLGYLFGLASLCASAWLAAALSKEDRGLAGLAPLMLAALPHFGVAATNGLESTLMIAVCLGAVAAYLSGPPLLAGSLAGLLLWTRPEGAAVVGLLGAASLLRDRRSLGRLLSWFGPASGALVLLVGLRLAFYGRWLPNTYDAKAHFPLSQTFSVNAAYFEPESAVLCSFLLALGLGSAMRPYCLDKWLVAACGLALGLAPLTVYDWMPALRLYLPAFAFACSLLAAGVGQYRRGAWAAAALLLASAALAYESRARVVVYDRQHSAEQGSGAERAAEHLAAQLPAGSWLAIRDAGVVAFFVGPAVEVGELHQRALTLPHPDGGEADVLSQLPPDPEVLVVTMRTPEQPEIEYRNDRRVITRMKAHYDYLGRVRQHHRRYYDIYVRADLGVTPLPEELVVSRPARSRPLPP